MFWITASVISVYKCYCSIERNPHVGSVVESQWNFLWKQIIFILVVYDQAVGLLHGKPGSIPVLSVWLDLQLCGSEMLHVTVFSCQRLLPVIWPVTWLSSYSSLYGILPEGILLCYHKHSQTLNCLGRDYESIFMLQDQSAKECCFFLNLMSAPESKSAWACQSGVPGPLRPRATT